MKTKRIVSLILCALMLLGSVSCSDKQNDTESSTVGTDSGSQTESSTELVYPDDIPEGTTFGGEEVRSVVNRDRDSIFFDEDEDDIAEPFNEAVWKRNNLVEDRLDVNIVKPTVIDDNSSKYVNAIVNSATAGSDDYDLVIGHARFNIELLLSNVLLCLDTLNYIDLDKEYWSQGFNDNIAYNNDHFWAVGDISRYYISSTYAVFVNEVQWNNHFSGENIYDIVRDGKWTLDKLTTYAAGAYVDTNGDGNRDNSDAYGFVSSVGHTLNGMFFASNVQYTDYDSEGVPSIVFNNEHTINVFEKIHDFMYNGDGTYILSDTESDEDVDVTMFTEDRVLFMPGQLSTLENETIREMDTNFYTIPMPKYNEEQENYRASQHDGTPIYGLLNTISENRIDAVSATFEAMCSLASTMVIPVYYDDILKSKYSRDPDTADMIDLIRDSLETDFALVWSDSLKTSSIFGFFMSNLQRDSITSLLEKSEKVWVKDLAALVEQLDEIADQYR